MNGFGFEVITKREIPQHLEECVMVGRHTDIRDITRSQALLTGRCLGEFDLSHAKKLILELIHSRRGKQNRGVIFRDKHIGGTANTPFGNKEF